MGTTAQSGLTTPSAQPQDFNERGFHVMAACTIDRPPAELFAFWRNFANLPRFMGHVLDVQVLSPTRSHWRVKGPAGRDVEWDAEIINEEPHRLIAWRTVDAADVDSAGSVWFVETPNGATEVRVNLDYIPPGGRLGEVVATAFGANPKDQIGKDLRRFKELVEGRKLSSSEGCG